jgi:Fe-Mn family superoxide dismutase
MDHFIPKTFNIPTLKGISAKNIDEHLKLYAGYVTNANLILKKIPEYEGYAKEDTFAPYAVNEIRRRFSFEYNGMRNHELFFASFEGGPKAITAGGTLSEAINKEFGSYENFLTRFKATAMTRGIGWAMLSLDTESSHLLIHWLDEQHLGQLQSAKPLLALDIWEHSFVADYQPSGKKQYVDDFFENLNWEVIEKRF